MLERRNLRHRHASPRNRRWLKLFLVLVFLVPAASIQLPVTPVAADDLSDAVRQQQELDKLIAEQKRKLGVLAAQQQKLQTQMTATQKSLDDLSLNIDDIQAQIDELKVSVDAVHASYDELATKEAELQAQLDDLVARVAAKQEELRQRQELLAHRLVAAYQTDQMPLLARILGAGSLTDALSDVAYFLDLGAQDAILAEQIKKDREELLAMETQVEIARESVGRVADQVEQQKSMLDQEMGSLKVAQSKLVTMQNQLNKQIAAQKAAAAKLAANKAALAAAIKSNGEAAAKLAEKINKLAAQQGTAGHIPSEYNGTLTWPMGGKISQEFGCTGWPGEPRVGSCAHYHQGIDIVAPCYTPVRAAGSGVVVFVGYNSYDPPPRAWLVIIAHSSHLVTWYAHMTGSAPAGIYYGAQVSGGQVIGTENTTGHSTGCHLHWAVLVDGKFKNPRLFV